MSESRGAASVTLDTIIANALRELSVKERGPGNVGSYEDAARAVTDALLAKGREGWLLRDSSILYYRRINGSEHGIWLPTEVSS